MLNKATKIINKQAEERTVMADKAKAVIKDAQDALKVLAIILTIVNNVIETLHCVIDIFSPNLTLTHTINN